MQTLYSWVWSHYDSHYDIKFQVDVSIYLLHKVIQTLTVLSSSSFPKNSGKKNNSYFELKNMAVQKATSNSAHLIPEENLYLLNNLIFTRIYLSKGCMNTSTTSFEYIYIATTVTCVTQCPRNTRVAIVRVKNDSESCDSCSFT